MLKEFTGKLRYMKRNILMHKYTLSFETVRLGLVPFKENFAPKITIAQFSLTPSSTLNCLIMIWLTIPAHIIILLPSFCLLLTTGMSELKKIHLLADRSGPSNFTQDLSMKITLEKSIFPCFLTQF